MDGAGIVIVSHSHHLSVGLAQLLHQLAPNVCVAVAAASDDTLGTSAESIRKAILEMHTSHVVLVLFDLGSSLLNAEMAIELLDPDTQARVHVVDAPMVEGAVAAAVALQSGLSWQAAIREAENARMTPKIAK
ncbi:PTS-dependent dihydroxyacetone kinase phosphotransferase subunit DhaM [Alicyclobacillus mali]|uniref:phosphoenolpyruvate--glycerone phosphotransferase n=1 Tax=Alicyclobacillus mali (ex Roth et al. 2021) TaxID=1123961 RepID=A0ABS0F3J7_9BACL|nr:dihydroxyacetone kinase phosphoryl donor subunit DhaM [Alicyclobacillus mali (ex Roth et al. 2021)]MBF8377862.1 PTS-dependent dihydroxyacetone kinase phosphotransferase subunit DhaM [Alicyclobacillus mali (ex Roth et al. 2021)]MCL6490031.1 PTS-dependent dihydroxyacetone kinase phosphotransferase subunit DhaM [Alicyclobacillus mali (ex Roth et al. 2021)]